MEYKVRKKLETPLMIRGMLKNYFYIFAISAVVLALFMVGSISSIVKGDFGFSALFGLFFPCVCFVAMQIIFVKLSRGKKFRQFKNTRYVISNKDIYNCL